MAHNEVRSNPKREAILALFTGSIYGGTHTLTGHPLDTIKAKMQIQKEFFGLSSFQVARKIYSTQGIKGFFKGVVHPLWGSAV